ncbi:sulfite exporter TauE/SafE family protein [Flaviaesturariibacter flavus]|uniref:sulfite exporter TauE/SafE family protein n=1 Tax=Flaviaesturariibacter flavus TaxID=2502780 RepID=UPI001FB29EE9|nr:TSUP family transporter [Flaviaesturariibacter flavus]
MNEITLQIILLCAAAFAAGFIDAIVGGGGLIQTPLSFVVLGAQPAAAILATVKIPSFCGTAMATRQYLRQVRIRWPLAVVSTATAFFASFGGSLLLTRVPNVHFKPIMLVVLIGVAIYTFVKKDFGQRPARDVPFPVQIRAAVLSSLLLGFYDGFIGPGTGSFLIMAFILVIGFDFLQASAHAKLTNLATNLGSITLFLIKGKILWAFALPMAAANACGGYLGARLAIAKGNRFIRVLFLVVVLGTLLRFAYDVFRGFL